MDREYVLIETKSPDGYFGLDTPLTVKLTASEEEGWRLVVTPDEGDTANYYEAGTEIQTDTVSGLEYLTLTIKNRPYEFLAVKTDETNADIKLTGAKFKLYKQTSTGSSTGWSNDAMAWDGNDILETDQNGRIPHLDNQLPAGTYQLREQAAPDGYSKLSGNIDFTVSQSGRITLGNHPNNVVLTGPVEGIGNQAGKLVYTLTIPNDPIPLIIKKVDESNGSLEGAKFSLSKRTSGQSGSGGPMWSSLEGEASANNTIDMTAKSETSLSDLPAGTYRLEETKAPAGYIIQEKYHYFVIDSDRTVTLCDENGRKVTGNSWRNAILGQKDGIYTITIKNHPGAELPDAGGPGTALLYFFGSMIMCLAGAGLIMKKRKMVSS